MKMPLSGQKITNAYATLPNQNAYARQTQQAAIISDADMVDALRWRMHIKMMSRRHAPHQIQETIDAVYAEIRAELK